MLSSYNEHFKGYMHRSLIALQEILITRRCIVYPTVVLLRPQPQALQFLAQVTSFQSTICLSLLIFKLILSVLSL